MELDFLAKLNEYGQQAWYAGPVAAFLFLTYRALPARPKKAAKVPKGESPSEKLTSLVKNALKDTTDWTAVRLAMMSPQDPEYVYKCKSLNWLTFVMKNAVDHFSGCVYQKAEMSAFGKPLEFLIPGLQSLGQAIAEIRRREEDDLKAGKLLEEINGARRLEESQDYIAGKVSFPHSTGKEAWLGPSFATEDMVFIAEDMVCADCAKSISFAIGGKCASCHSLSAKSADMVLTRHNCGSKKAIS